MELAKSLLMGNLGYFVVMLLLDISLLNHKIIFVDIRCKSEPQIHITACLYMHKIMENIAVSSIKGCNPMTSGI